MMSFSRIAFAAAFLTPIQSQAGGNISIPPAAIMTKIVEHMPKGDKQEIRVLTASINPGDRTVFHTHPFPVTLYILGWLVHAGDGRPPLIDHQSG